MSKTNFIRVPGKKPYIFHPDSNDEEKLEELKPGVYIGGIIQTLFTRQYTYEPWIPKEGMVKFTSGIVKDVMRLTQGFFSEETTKKYEQLAVAQKMAILMYGPAGTGKTVTAQIIMTEMAARYGAICIDFTGKHLDFIKDSIAKVRSAQNNPVVAFIDEIDNSFIQEEYNYLPFLDGTDSITNFILLGCTNHLSHIPKRIRERKSRIKYAVRVKSLPTAVYQEFVNAKLTSSTDTIRKEFVYRSEEAGLTIDEVKHAIIDHVIEGLSVEDAIKEVQKYSKAFKEDEIEEDDDKWEQETPGTNLSVEDLREQNREIMERIQKLLDDAKDIQDDDDDDDDDNPDCGCKGENNDGVPPPETN